MSDTTLWQGDCLELMARIPDGSIDAIINDPPFGTTNCKWDIALDLERYWSEMERVLKPTGVVLMFAAQPFTSKLILSRPDLYRHLWYWQKEKGTNFFRTRYQPLRIIEEIAVFAPTMDYTYNPQLVPLDKPYRHTMPLRHSAITGEGMIDGRQSAEARQYKVYTHGQPTNLLQFPRDNANKGWLPTQKPVALMAYLIRTYSNAGDVICDPTMGTGSCGVAAVQLERQFVGIELNPQHFDVASQRIAAEGVVTFA